MWIGWDWDWDWDLCAGLFYEHRFAMLKSNYRRKLALSEDELEKGSVRDHEDDKEGEGEGDLLERLDNPKQSETKGLKNGEENHPENARFHWKISS